METKYKIGEVAISADGRTFWIGYYGEHADQGGNTIRWGEIGLNSIEAGMAVLLREIQENMGVIQSKLDEKNSK
jgi:hypothetical protein